MRLNNKILNVLIYETTILHLVVIFEIHNLGSNKKEVNTHRWRFMTFDKKRNVLILIMKKKTTTTTSFTIFAHNTF